MTRRFVSAVSIGLCSIFLWWSAFWSSQAAPSISTEQKPFPSVASGRVAHGREIISVLGDQFPDVAQWYGKSSDELRSIVTRDKSIHADRSGRLHYACENGV